jgi:putative phage-type endonuclease
MGAIKLKEYDRTKCRALGGGDAAIIMGAAKWRTRRDLALYKRGDIERQEQTDIMRRGLTLEPFLAAVYEERIGHKLEEAGKIWAHSEKDHLCAQVDALIEDDGQWEGKTSSKWVADQWGDLGTEEIPDSAYCQVQHGMGVTGRSWCDVTVVIGDDAAFDVLCKMADNGVDVSSYVAQMDVRTYRIKRNEKFIVEMFAIEDEFWERYVVGDNLPDDLVYMKHRDGVRPATESEDTEIAILKGAWIDVKQAEKHLEQMKEQVKEMVGASEGIDSRLGKVTWKKGKDKTVVDWKALAEALMESFRMFEEERDLIIADHTTTVPTARRFNVPCAWGKEV